MQISQNLIINTVNSEEQEPSIIILRWLSPIQIKVDEPNWLFIYLFCENIIARFLCVKLNHMA